MKKVFLFFAFFAMTLLLSTAAFAGGDEEPFIQFARGNYWNYNVVERGKKKSGKMEVTEITEKGEVKVKVTGMDAPSENMCWKVGKEFLMWEMAPGLNWKVVKFGAKKGDTWKSGFSDDAPTPEGMPKMELVLNSCVLEVEDIKTPAGVIKGCVKVQTRPVGDGEGTEAISMWWAKGIGLVKLEVARRGEVSDSWLLTTYKTGPDISDEKLKEMVDRADVVALVGIPKEGAGSQKVQVKLAGLYKGEPKEEEGDIVIAQPREGSDIKAFEAGDFVVFLKKEGDALILLYSPMKADNNLDDRLTKLVTPPDQSIERLKELCGKAQIIVGVEIVVLEERGSFRYYVAKVIQTAKGAEGRKYLDIVSPEGVEFQKGKKLIFFLVDTEESGRKLTKPVDAIRGVLDYDEGLLNELAEIVKGSK